MPQKKKVVAAKKPKAEFIVTIEANGQIFKAEGKTIAEAIGKLFIRQYKTKAVVKVEHEGIEKQVRIMPRIMRKMVMPLNRQFLDKRLQLLLR